MAAGAVAIAKERASANAPQPGLFVGPHFGIITKTKGKTTDSVGSLQGLGLTPGRGAPIKIVLAAREAWTSADCTIRTVGGGRAWSDQ